MSNSLGTTLVIIATTVIATILVANIPLANAVFVNPGTTQSGQTNQGKPGCGPSQSNDVAAPCGNIVPDQPGPSNPPGDRVCEVRSSFNCNPPQ
jgi:hypothetical protein